MNFEKIYPNEYLDDNTYVGNRDRIDDVVCDVQNSLYDISQAIDVILRPELKERLENLYTEEYINELKEFSKASNKMSGYNRDENRFGKL